MHTLISTLGGDTPFTSRLDFFHDSGLADLGNEPVFLTVFQYHYAGRPDLSAARVRSYIPSRFNASHGGLPGNDDSGAMGAFAFFALVGLFPSAGQDVYLITPPFFDEVRFEHPVTGKVGVVRVVGGSTAGGDGGGGGEAVSIQSATLDGRLYKKSWIRHEFFTRGGVLELVLGVGESDWGRAVEDRPPSW